MKISSKLKKIISLMMILVVLIGTVVFPVSAAGQAGEWEDTEYHEAYEDFSDCPKYTADDLVYNGELSTDVRINFNIKKQYGLDWTTDTGFYMSRPFSLRRRWDSGDSSGIVNFTGNYSNINQLFSKDRFDTIASSSFVKSNDIVMSGYDVYYTLRTSYSVTREYGYLSMTYIFVPKDHRIAISNQNKDEDGSGSIKYGVWLSSDGTTSDIAPIYNSCWSVTFQYGTEGGSVTTHSNGFYGAPFSDWLGMGHMNLIATNIPVFTKADAAKQYIMSGESTEDPTNKIPDGSKENEKIGADAFFWDSLKCRIVESGECYKLIFDYSYSAKDMVENFNSYQINVDMTQSAKYKVSGDNNIYTYTNKDYHSSLNIGKSPGSAVDQASMLSFQTWGAGGTILRWGLQAWSDFWGTDRDWTAVNFINSYIYVYVELVHVQPGGNGLFIKDKVSSDIRTFKFDALTLESLDDPEEITPDVKVDEIKDSNGNVVDKKVSQVVVNDNSTHQTINNYYYDSDGNKKESSGSAIGDSLSDIASGLIKFIKTLVTEGLPAALEILKSLIKTISDLLGFIGDQIGDIGQGTQNGIVAVLKAIPVPLWGICSVALIVFVIVGILKHIF